LKPAIRQTATMAPASYRHELVTLSTLQEGIPYLAEALHSEDCAHHSSSPFGSCESMCKLGMLRRQAKYENLLRCNDRRQRIITTNSCVMGQIRVTARSIEGVLPMPIMTRQKIIRPTMDTAGEGAERD
jgi:hypothetical protein